MVHLTGGGLLGAVPSSPSVSVSVVGVVGVAHAGQGLRVRGERAGGGRRGRVAAELAGVDVAGRAAVVPTVERGLLLAGDGGPDRVEEVGEGGVEVVLGDAEVPVEEEEELFLHEVDLLELEEAHGVGAPVLVLRGRVVQVLGAEDEGGEEDAVAGAGHALGHGRQPVPQPIEVDHGRHEGRRLDPRLFAEDGDEGLERGQARVKGDTLGRGGRRERGGVAILAADDRVGLGREGDNHLRRDLELDKLLEGLLVAHGRMTCV